MSRIKNHYHDEFDTEPFDPSPYPAYPFLTPHAEFVAVLLRQDTRYPLDPPVLLGAYTDRMDAEYDLSMMLAGQRLFHTPDYFKFHVATTTLNTGDK